MNETASDTLLIVDDMPDNVRVLHEFLKQAGFHVLVSVDGEDGIETTEYANPDLILLDIMMPGMSGFTVCERLKSQASTKDIPIIFITALSDTRDKIKGFSLGAADYITKPFQQEEVLARVYAHLNLYKLQRRLTAEIAIRQQVEDSLRHKIMELDAFAYTVAHDLKNPLTGVMNLAEVLVQTCPTNEPPAPQWLKRLRMVANSGKQMLNIINAVLLLAGLSKQEEITFVTLDMNSILVQVQQRLNTMLQEYQATLDIPNHWPLSIGYAPWVAEIWANYISNGLKYGGQPPRLQLGADVQNAGMVRFWVRDNGIGLTQAAQEQLFTPFTRVHIKPVEGHGLGLSIVQRIVEKLGGQAGVESEMNKGSLFYFTLPAA